MIPRHGENARLFPRAFEVGFGTTGIALRLLLFWINPPQNAFDDHFGPIFWIMRYGRIAPKNALWQSYQPPVFYVISAGVGKLALSAGIPVAALEKLLQFLPCLYGILTLGVVHSILRRLPLSDRARLMAFGFACFLPQHIYLSAMHSNDTCAILGASLCLLNLLIVIEEKFSYARMVLLSALLVITLFTKYTTLVVLPTAAALLFPAVVGRSIEGRTRWWATLLLLVVVPCAVFGLYARRNLQDYGNPLPTNAGMLDPGRTQPRYAEGLSFLTFEPWKTVETPILTPANLGSFWTLLYSRMWFDLEPKFLYLIDHNIGWWSRYYRWLRGERPFPQPMELPLLSRISGSILIALGLFPLLLGICGAARAALRPGFLRLLPIYCIFNVAGVILLTLRFPVFSAVKAGYLLNSLPAFAVFVGLGFDFVRRNRTREALANILLGALFLATTLHILHIAVSNQFRPGV